MERLRIVAGYVVLALWAGSVILSMVDRTYTPPNSIPLALAALTTLLFAKGLLQRFNGKDES